MTQPVDFIKDARMKADFMAFLNAESSQEQERIVNEYNKWFAELTPEEQAAVTASRMESMRSFLEGAEENLAALDAAVIKQKLGNMPKALSLSYISRTYFGKTSTWLYQRINGNKVNGKEARFTREEAYQLQNALHDLGSKLSSITLV